MEARDKEKAPRAPSSARRGPLEWQAFIGTRPFPASQDRIKGGISRNRLLADQNTMVLRHPQEY
jgi:hypothetical protein